MNNIIEVNVTVSHTHTVGGNGQAIIDPKGKRACKCHYSYCPVYLGKFKSDSGL
jgi:xylose isomerase